MDYPQPTYSALPLQTFKRLPDYYNYLKGALKTNTPYISSAAMAREMGLNEVQVRKDLASVSKTPGKPRKGFDVLELMECIGECLGYHNRKEAVLIGAGRLGRALLSYPGFEEHGVQIVAAFDADRTLTDIKIGGKQIFSMEKLPSLIRRLQVHIGIIAVPAEAAQDVCDVLVQNGVAAIWNFAPAYLKTPKDVLVQNENLAASLAVLSQRLSDKPKD
ncbi:redox-sensing transcriptional repressor Rex [Christensenellaceae bacterium OttesenSCG-928-M15]|nr:redox-sensing transcriptional repressor Rex [Christensenellaceae bacterium OttesenSCG-928-M15]